jgi:hypothetical protein
LKYKKLDNWGVLLSSVCAVHCLLLPILMFAFPAISVFFVGNESLWHQLILFFTLPAVAFALYSTLKIHGQKKPLIYVSVGLAFVILGTFLVHEYIGHEAEPIFVVIGSLLMIRGHLLNKHHCNKCESDHHCPWDHE